MSALRQQALEEDSSETSEDELSSEHAFVPLEEISEDEINHSLQEILLSLKSKDSSHDLDEDDAASRFLAKNDPAEQEGEALDDDPDEDHEDEHEGALLTLDALLSRSNVLNPSDSDDADAQDDDEWVIPDRSDFSGSADPLRIFFREMERYPLLTAKQEIELAIRCQQGDEDARALFVASNLRLVVHVAKKYISSGIPMIDLIAEGNLGLLEAVRRFSPDKGCRFSTYATWWVRQTVQRSVHNDSRTIRVPVHMSQLQRKLFRTEALLKQSGLSVRDEDLAEAMGIELGKLQQIRDSITPTLSLDKPVGEEGSTSLMDQIASEDDEGGVAQLFSSGNKAWLKEALRFLTEKERYVLRCRFGIELNHEMTLDEVGASLNLTRERIRQIEVKALRRLRYYFSRQGIGSEQLLGT